MPTRQPLRLVLITTPPPCTAGEGRPTEFGLQDRDENLAVGVLAEDGRLGFTLDLEVSQDPATHRVRFHSPCVHGPAAAKFLYLGWRYTDGPREWVRRQKLPLGSLSWEQVAAEEGVSRTFAAEVPSIVLRCATIPVEWRLVTGSEA